MNTPLYDRACALVEDLHANLEANGEAIEDPAEKLRYYAMIALGMVGGERKLVEIRRRAELTLEEERERQLALAALRGEISPRRLRKRTLVFAIEEAARERRGEEAA